MQQQQQQKNLFNNGKQTRFDISSRVNNWSINIWKKVQLMPLAITETIIILKLRCHLTFLQTHTLKDNQNVPSVDNDTKILEPFPYDDWKWNCTATSEQSMDVTSKIKLSCYMN